jgi:hypothetical protein
VTAFGDHRDGGLEALAAIGDSAIAVGMIDGLLVLDIRDVWS